MDLERQFVKNYLFDPVYGGTYLSVGGSGNVINDSKDVIFQTNVILFLAGMNTQSPDPDTVRLVDSAGKFILNYLKWEAGGRNLVPIREQVGRLTATNYLDS
jgi:hypothetical protein